jgi:RNA polymerase sigma-70 factor, ECF subfamily
VTLDRSHRHTRARARVVAGVSLALAEPDVQSARLVARAQAGDKAALPELYEQHFDGVYAYLRVALRDEHEAEDAAQEVFVSAMRGLPGYEPRPGTPFRAWLFRIARNEAINRMRKLRRVEVEDPEQIGRRCAEALPTGTLARVSDDELLGMLECLPAVQRQALALRYMLDLTTEEVATVLGRTPDAVRQLEYRARRSLHARLAPLRTKETRFVRSAMVMRMRPLPVLRARRFVLAP